MHDTYVRLFGSKARINVYSPLEKGDHPELDTSEFLETDDTLKYQSLIGSMQWVILLGRFDIATAVMTLSSYRAVPRIGHLDRAKRIVSYLMRFKDACIRYRTNEPDYTDLPERPSEWDRSIYGDVEELLPHDAPKPLGRTVVLTHYVDANLYHDWITGRSVTGILSLLNQTPIDWYSKKQSTVETATYGSEFVATRICIDRAVDLRTTLRYLGVPLAHRDVVFGDNESVVNSSMRLDAKLHKRHNALSFHRVREAIAAGYIQYFHMPGKTNPADVLSKHWGYSDVWPTLQPFLFWKGETAKTLLTPSSDQRDHT
ncbi:hypothetical protein IV203_031461 [Nitzschia inconspicua]|uniref:Uncharacterized protein n=1 Tax=Nitzschia inconspicua TaxID=303405 RepID=A0A9K3LVC7_9STRA|nr:hypothetical protein IV203_031461 [Nitzschia inconspicua]